MIRSEIIESFRTQSPEITSRVITDVQCNTWLEQGDKMFCAETRCIVDQDGTDITTVANDVSYDLASEITKFFDVDTYPGSGVLFDGERIIKVTMAELDMERKTWRDRSAGTPKKWYRRGTYLYMDRPILTAGLIVKVYSVLISDDWTTDVAPYNQLTYLEPFHEAMVLYLTMRAKAKIAKPQEAKGAMSEFMNYMAWAKKQLGGNKYSPIYYRKKI